MQNRGLKIAPWAVLVWLIIWQLTAMVIGHDLILVTPAAVIVRLAELIIQASFWLTIGTSFLRIISGFLIATILGIVLAMAAARSKIVEQLLAPPLLFIKTTPVAAFIIVLLVWISSADLSIATSFLVVLPITFINILEGLRATDSKLLELAKVFELPRWRRFRFISIPQVLPYFRAACSITLGMCWKAGIAAEVIGNPTSSIGEQLYLSKLYLDTTELFAWVIVILLISFLFEKAFLKCLELGINRFEKPKHLAGFQRGSIQQAQAVQQQQQQQQQDINISKLSIKYGQNSVLQDVSLRLPINQVSCLIAPSGSGKTTLLNILLGLTAPDSGSVAGLKNQTISAVFQEDRLCEDLSGVTNVLICAKEDVDIRTACKMLHDLGMKGHTDKPVKELSGGMRRRVVLARALLASYDLLIMDEPFKGLDDALRASVIAEVKCQTANKTVIMVTHDVREAKAMDARIFELPIIDKE